MTQMAFHSPQHRFWRLCAGAVFAVALGVGVSAIGAYFISDLTQVSAEDLREQAYLSDMRPDEDMLRLLSEQLARDTGNNEYDTLNEIAPAAGAPLGE